jgi:hypothetical protein
MNKQSLNASKIRKWPSPGLATGMSYGEVLRNKNRKKQQVGKILAAKLLQ